MWLVLEILSYLILNTINKNLKVIKVFSKKILEIKLYNKSSFFDLIFILQSLSYNHFIERQSDKMTQFNLVTLVMLK